MNLIQLSVIVVVYLLIYDVHGASLSNLETSYHITKAYIY